MQLEDIERIKQLKHRYCRFLDTANAAGLAAVLTEDIEIDYVGGTYHFKAKGREEVVALLNAAFHEDFVGCHTVSQPEITILSPDTSEGRWMLTDYAFDLRTGYETSGACLYRDRYAKIDGEWRIAWSSYRRLFERVTKLDTLPNFTARYLAERTGNPDI